MLIPFPDLTLPCRLATSVGQSVRGASPRGGLGHGWNKQLCFSMARLIGYQRTYYWRVDTILKDGTVGRGDVSAFTTGERHIRAVLEVAAEDEGKVTGRSRNEDSAP